MAWLAGRSSRRFSTPGRLRRGRRDAFLAVAHAEGRIPQLGEYFFHFSLERIEIVMIT
jgi:hypothetical protein